MRDLLKEKGFFVVSTQTSMYIVDADAKKAKRMPNSFSLSSKFDVSNLRKDGEWMNLKEARASLGQMMLLVVTGVAESNEIITLRHTTPVISILHKG
jgi:hypothetical protein